VNLKLIYKFAIASATASTLVGCSTLADAVAARGTGKSTVYDSPFEKVWSNTAACVPKVGLELVTKNIENHYVLAQRAVTAFSYGENVAIFIDSMPDGKATKVEVVTKRAMSTNVFAPDWAEPIFYCISQSVTTKT